MLRGSIPRLGQRRFTGGVGYFRDTGGGFVSRVGSDGGGMLRTVNLGKKVAKTPGYCSLDGFRYYPQQKGWPSFVMAQGCTLPLSEDCLSLRVTPRWAIGCFKPMYHRLREIHGDDYEAIVDDIVQKEIPACNIGGPTTGAEQELYRRLRLATATLMNMEGVAVRYPKAAPFPRPKRAQQISQPWMRALLTGWV